MSQLNDAENDVVGILSKYSAEEARLEKQFQIL